MIRYPPKDKQDKQDINHILILDFTGYQHRQAFPGIFIHDVQYLESSAVSRAIYHKIIAPDMVLTPRSEPDA
jgi:hypothetical protein